MDPIISNMWIHSPDGPVAGRVHRWRCSDGQSNGRWLAKGKGWGSAGAHHANEVLCRVCATHLIVKKGLSTNVSTRYALRCALGTGRA